MDCGEPPRTGQEDQAVVALVRDLREAGAASVLIGVVGPGADRLRPLAGPTEVRSLTAEAGAALDEVAGQVFPVAGRCVVVVRREDFAWSWVVTGDLAGASPAPTTVERAPGEPVGRSGAQIGAGFAVGRFTCSPDFSDGDSSYPSGSPFVFAAVEVGIEPVYLFLGLDSAPTYRYGGGGCHVILGPVAMVTAGVWGGSDEVRAGPYAAIGIAALEAGVRAAVTPWGRGRPRHGVEARAAWLGDRAVLLAVAYTAAWR